MKERLNEAGIPYGARKKMPFWYSLAWSSRGISAALNVILIGYVTYYATDMLRLSALTIGSLLMVSKIIDAITDLGAGYLIDKTHTRFGKARPYEIFIVLEWIFTVLLFSAPEGNQTLQYVWLFALYVLINAVCTTALGAADAVYMARTFTTENNRLKAMSVNGVVVMFISIIFNIMTPLLINSVGATKSGWTVLAISLAVPLSLIGILRFIFCKEIETSEDMPGTETGKKIDDTLFKDKIGALAKNKPLFIVVVLMLITMIINGMSTAQTYYFKYIMGNLDLMSVASMTAMVTPFMLFFFPALSRKMGTTRILQVGAGLGIFGMLIRTIGGANMTTIMIGSLFSALATMPISMMINTYLIDCMDYGEWRTGIRVEGLVASVVNFANKLGGSIASGLIGVVMGMAGYKGELEVQPASANAAIAGLYNLLPLFLYIIFLVLAIMYPVDKVRSQMTEDLQRKHGEKK